VKITPALFLAWLPAGLLVALSLSGCTDLLDYYQGTPPKNATLRVVAAAPDTIDTPQGPRLRMVYTAAWVIDSIDFAERPYRALLEIDGTALSWGEGPAARRIVSRVDSLRDTSVCEVAACVWPGGRVDVLADLGSGQNLVVASRTIGVHGETSP
jgi:hypothetical protein